MDEEKKTKKVPSFDLFSVMCHSLKSPLNTVETYLDIFKNKILGEDITSYLPMVDQCFVKMHEMRELIEDISDWARIEMNQSPRELTEVNLLDLLQSVINSLKEQINKKNIKLTIIKKENISLPAVPKEIILMLRHLIDNAIKYNKDNGSVTISLRKEGQKIYIDVTDTGIGMSSEELQKIFQEFVRIKNSKTRDIQGTGLGLAITKKLAKFYHGNISAVSITDEGSTFSLVLEE